jgi:hypothetical protein
MANDERFQCLIATSTGTFDGLPTTLRTSSITYFSSDPPPLTLRATFDHPLPRPHCHLPSTTHHLGSGTFSWRRQQLTHDATTKDTSPSSRRSCAPILRASSTSTSYQSSHPGIVVAYRVHPHPHPTPSMTHGQLQATNLESLPLNVTASIFQPPKEIAPTSTNSELTWRRR